MQPQPPYSKKDHLMSYWDYGKNGERKLFYKRWSEIEQRYIGPLTDQEVEDFQHWAENCTRAMLGRPSLEEEEQAVKKLLDF